MTPEQQQARQTALALGQEATQLESNNRWQEALPLRRQLADVLIRAFGTGSSQADQGRRALAESLTLAGQYPEARAVLEQCLAARTAALGNTNPAVADALLRIGETWRRQGNLTNAWDWYARAERVVADAPAERQLRGMIANNQALVLSAQGDFLGAAKRYQAALNEFGGLPNAGAHLAATCLNGLAEVQRAAGLVELAAQTQFRALALISNQPPLAAYRTLFENNLAAIYRDQGRCEEALALYERVGNALTAQRGSNDLEVVTLRRNVALTLARQGEQVEALTIIEEALRRLDGSQRTNHPLYLGLRNDRADRWADLGDVTAARAEYERSLQLQRAQSGDDHPLVWSARERLAIMALRQADLAAARELSDQVLAYRQQRAALGPKQQEELATTLLERVRFARALGRDDETERRLAALRTQAETHLGTNHPLAAHYWSQVALFALDRGQFDAALIASRQARAISVQACGERSLLAAESQELVGGVLARQGRFEEALKETRAARKIIATLVGPESPQALTAEFNLASLLAQAGKLDEAATLYQSVLGQYERRKLREAPAVASDLALLEASRGQAAAALPYARRAAAMQEELWRNVLRFASANDRLAWQGSSDVFSALAAVAKVDPEPLAQAVLRYKGAVLDSLIEDAQVARLQPGSAAQVAALRAAREEVSRLELAAFSRQPPSPEDLRQARARLEDLERTLAGQVVALAHERRALTATTTVVQQHLPPGSVLVEYVRFRTVVPHGQAERKFGALVIGATGPPRWIDLGAADGESGIATTVAKWRSAIRQDPPPAESTVTALLKDLHDRLWAPVAAALPEKPRTIIVAPDAELNFVPFAALWTDGHFLGEDLPFRYVTSGRDLLAPAYVPPKVKSVCILGDPEFERSTWQRKVADPLRQSWQSACDVLAFRGSPGPEKLQNYARLPGTRAEAIQVAKIARLQGCEPWPPFLGAEATEAVLMGHPSPYVLHFATHGTFLPTPVVAVSRSARPARPEEAVILANPMHRSWVGLARANETLQAWTLGQVPDPLTDGVLTAEEAAQLPLAGTWLVTLSACDTGLGANQRGEGVFGLRRGFALAGARHVLMTLWPVDDQRTSQFMQAFYADALNQGDAPGALGRVQARLLKEWREHREIGPTSAARFAGAFLISSCGP